MFFFLVAIMSSAIIIRTCIVTDYCMPESSKVANFTMMPAAKKPIISMKDIQK